MQEPKRRPGRDFSSAAINGTNGMSKILRGLAVENDELDDRLDALEARLDVLENPPKKKSRKKAAQKENTDETNT